MTRAAQSRYRVGVSDFDPGAPADPDAGLYGLDVEPSAAGVLVIPVPFEATTSYGSGAALGPAAILAASHQVDLFDHETGRPYEAGLAMLPPSERVLALNAAAKADARAVIDGQLEGAEAEAARARVNAASAELESWLYGAVAGALERGQLVGVVGGDHSVPLGAIRAVAERFGPIGVLHLDAHADLRRAYMGFEQSHASIMDNVLRRVPRVVRLVQVGIRDYCEEERARIDGSDDRVVTHYGPELARARARGQLLKRFQDIADALPRRVHLSFDIDGLDPKLCPHTGTPVPGGLDFDELCMLLETVVTSGREIVGFDLCEVAPGPDGDEWDANVGARVLYKMIGWALKSREAR